MKSFVLMPFDPEFDDIYDQFVSVALNDAGYETVRADDIRNQRNILNDIIESIVESDIIVADLTALNTNVFYELGLSHTLGKDVILLSQNVDNIPFDLQLYRVVSYGTHFTEMEEAKEELEKLAREAREGEVAFGNPVTDFANNRGLGIRELHQRALSSSVSTGVEPTEADKGFLDYSADFEEATLEMNNIVRDINRKMDDMEGKTREIAIKIKAIQKDKGLGSASKMRQHARELARNVNEFADFLAEKNDRYSNEIADVKDNLDRILSLDELDEDIGSEEEEALKEFSRMANKLEENARDARDSVNELSSTMLEKKGIESHLSLSLDRGAAALDTYEEHIDQTITVFEKARIFAEEKLK